MYVWRRWLAVLTVSQGSQANLSAPTQAPTRYAEVGNVVEVGDEEEAEEKAPTSLRDAGPPGSARASEFMVLPPLTFRLVVYDGLLLSGGDLSHSLWRRWTR
jgi:hypothetical protein